MEQTMADLQFHNHGSVVTCEPITEAGQDWLLEHVSADAFKFDGVLIIEPRYLRDIVIGARADGLVCEG
jgi:hypothetical protein